MAQESEKLDSGGTELVVVSAQNPVELALEISKLVDFLNRFPGAPILDVAYTCAQKQGPCRFTAIASNAQDLRARLSSAQSRIASGAARIKDKSGSYFMREPLLGEGLEGKLAFIFPGVMSFYPDMLRDVTVAFPECREAFDELEEAMKDTPDFTPSNFIFPPAAYYRHDADIFSSGAYAQALVSVYSASASLARLMATLGVKPDGVVGCAGGDLAAVFQSGAAGPVSRHERISAIADIYRIVDKAVSHGGLGASVLVSVLAHHPGEDDAVVSEMPKGKVALAVEFTPARRVYAIDPEYADEALKKFANAGIRTMRLAIDKPFNTPKCAQIVPAIRKFADKWIRKEPLIGVYSCGLAARLPSKIRHARTETAARWAKSVRFADTIRKMHSDGYRVFVEVGPRGLMASAADDSLKDTEHLSIALNSIHRRSMLQLQHGLAQLAAAGAQIDLAPLYARRRAKTLDFASATSLEVRRDAEMRLARTFPKMTLLGLERKITGATYLAEAKGRGARAAERKAALYKEALLKRQFDSGAIQPLISDAEELESTPGISCELVKTFKTSEELFLADFAIGSSQLSYSDPNLRGLLLLDLSVGVEIAAEIALRVMPKGNVASIEDFTSRRRVKFTDGRLKLFVRAERVASSVPGAAAIKVKIRDDSPNSAYTWPVMEATVLLTEQVPPPVPYVPHPLSRPRQVHWSGREIYPAMLACGQRLRSIVSAENWAEEGLDYKVAAPPRHGAVVAASYPVWAVNPILLASIASGFQLWRSQERFPGAFAIPFRLRKLDMLGAMPAEGTTLNCYMRLSGVTPLSQLCDITVTGGDGNVIFAISGWEEQTGRVPKEYCQLLLQPANAFLTETISKEMLGNPATDVASAFITDIPYPLFERDEALWLKIMSHTILCDSERRVIADMTGSVARRTEWLIGRLAAKEAVRRFLKDNYQARWCDTDVQICPNPAGKPIAIGDWRRYLTTKIDIAIAHTAQFVVALAAANARIGVDVESIRRDLSEEFANGVFTADELELAAQSSAPSQAFIRFWCAKEAISKALGTGIRYSPKELVIKSYNPTTGRITAMLEGGWVDAFKVFKGRVIEVTTRILRDHALAFSFIPDSLFDDYD